jgi:Tol biopolymer transport system component
VWVDRKGLEQALPAPARPYRNPRLSPNDGRRVAVAIDEQEMNVSVYDLARDTLTALTFQGNLNVMGAWTPDGKRIALSSTTKEGQQSLFWQWADGSGGLEPLTSGEHPDSEFLVWGRTTPRFC